MLQSNKQHKQTVVPSVRVKLIQSVQLPPRHDVKVSVQLEGNNAFCGPVLIESNSEYLPDGLSFAESLIATPEQKQTEVILTNPTDVTHQLGAGVNLGYASEVEVVSYASPTSEIDNTDKIMHCGGTGKEANHLTSVLTVKTLDVANRKENLVNYLLEKELH